MSTHNYNAPRAQTKEFELVTRAEKASLGFPVRQPRSEKPVTSRQATPNSSLLDFHEEFKSLVLADEETASEEDPTAESFIELFEPHEIEWNDLLDGATTTRPATIILPIAAATRAAVKPAPQQAVRPLAGPRLGTPVPIETWVVKVIMALVGLNLLFAGLIVAGVRLSDLFQ